MKKLKDLLFENSKYKIDVGLYDFDIHRWVISQEESNRYYGGARVLGVQIPNIVYHGTSKRSSDNILKTGLSPMSFVALDPEKSSMYGDVVLEIHLPRDYKISWGEDKKEFQTVKRIDPKYIQIYQS